MLSTVFTVVKPKSCARPDMTVETTNRAAPIRPHADSHRGMSLDLYRTT